jgi:hypothetical protein
LGGLLGLGLGGLSRCGLSSRGLLGGRGRLLGGGFLGRGGGAGAFAGVADHGEFGADLDGLVLGGLDLEQGAGDRRRDLGVDLVGRDLQQGLVDGNRVTDLLEPAGDGSFGDALPEGRQGYRGRHDGRCSFV